MSATKAKRNRLSWPAFRYVLASAERNFRWDGCMDIAAGLAYRTVFAVFPALIAFVAILALFGRSADTVSRYIEQASEVVPPETWVLIEPFIQGLLNTPAPTFGLIVGMLVALWTASSYVKAFGRALNRIYQVNEGRGPIKLNVQMYLLTALLLVLVASSVTLLAISGPIAAVLGDLFGIEAQALKTWNDLSWVFLIFVVIIVVAMLNYFTPNVKKPHFRILSVGAVLAIFATLGATALFFYYVGNFASYNATYGTLAGAIIFLLWVYLINLIFLFGAEIDAELERGIQLVNGIASEQHIQLPEKDRRGSLAKEAAQVDAIERARALRFSEGTTSDVSILPTSERETRLPGDVLPLQRGAQHTVNVGYDEIAANPGTGSNPEA